MYWFLNEREFLTCFLNKYRSESLDQKPIICFMSVVLYILVQCWSKLFFLVKFFRRFLSCNVVAELIDFEFPLNTRTC